MELLVEAERYLSHGLLDHAERLFRQVADADPKSSIAAVGLARVALERGDDATAYAFGRKAIAIDPENPAAHHLVLRLEEVVPGRGDSLPSEAEIARIVGRVPPAAAPATDQPPTVPTPAPEVDASQATARPARRRGLVGRLLGRRRR